MLIILIIFYVCECIISYIFLLLCIFFAEFRISFTQAVYEFDEGSPGQHAVYIHIENNIITDVTSNNNIIITIQITALINPMMSNATG